MNTFSFPPDVTDKIINTKTFTPLIFVPGFDTKRNRNTYRMDPNISAAHFVHETQGITDVKIRIAKMTILSAFEKVKEFNITDSAIKQFFNHIRNAAAHNGKFLFTKDTINQSTGELKKKAEWKEFKITSNLQDVQLFTNEKDDNSAFWDQGDFIDFLLDFENHYPEIKKN